ncbi:MAG: SMI1/KNR4 family protein [Bacteroidota bacterium]
MNNETIKRIDEIVALLERISKENFEAQRGLTEEEIEKSEIELGISFPVDFRYFLSKMNGISLYGELVLPALVTEENLSEVSISDVMKWERFEAVNPLPEYFLPFNPNGRGDHYCFDLRKKNKDGVCPVIFWQWDYSYHHPNDIEETNEDFTSWVQEVIEDLSDT